MKSVGMFLKLYSRLFNAKWDTVGGGGPVMPHVQCSWVHQDGVNGAEARGVT